MKTSFSSLIGSFALALCLWTTTGRAHGQGAITPTTPPTTPIMKTLSQVEPRTAIPGGNYYTIISPGSYYLTGNITVTGNLNALEIFASGVTLDLNGFTVTAVTGRGIYCSGASNVVIRNGILHGGNYGIEITGNTNSNLHDIRIESLDITDCAAEGIYAGSVSGLSISHCVISNIGSTTGGLGTCAGVFLLEGGDVHDCVIDKVVAGSTSLACGLNLTSSASASGNRISNCKIGIRNGKIQNNLTVNCTTPFSGTTDAGGNN